MKPLRLVLLALASAILPAQQQVQLVNPCINWSCYHAYTSGTVTSSSSTVLTIQEPATARFVQFRFAVVNCATQAFTITQAQNGTAATTTAGTAIPLTPSTRAASALVFTASNVGTGAVTALPLILAAGPQAIDLSDRAMSIAGNNYSITLTNNGASSCTGGTDIYWWEK